jgi:lysophospholipase L1-like esterase
MDVGTLCLFGDSVARGIVLEPDGRYAPIKDSFGALASLRLNIPIINKARFGCTVTKGLEIVKNFLKPDRLKGKGREVAILEFGGNDCDFRWDEVAANPKGDHKPGTSLDQFATIYRDIITDLKREGVRPILLTLPPLDPVRYFNWFTRSGLDREAILSWLGDVQFIYRWHERYNDAVWGIALESECSLIDIRKPFLERNDYSRYLCQDGIHPNREGHKLIESVILEYAQAR